MPLEASFAGCQAPVIRIHSFASSFIHFSFFSLSLFLAPFRRRLTTSEPLRCCTPLVRSSLQICVAGGKQQVGRAAASAAAGHLLFSHSIRSFVRSLVSLLARIRAQIWARKEQRISNERLQGTRTEAARTKQSVANLKTLSKNQCFNQQGEKFLSNSSLTGAFSFLLRLEPASEPAFIRLLLSFSFSLSRAPSVPYLTLNSNVPNRSSISSRKKGKKRTRAKRVGSQAKRNSCNNNNYYYFSNFRPEPKQRN